MTAYNDKKFLTPAQQIDAMPYGEDVLEARLSIIERAQRVMETFSPDDVLAILNLEFLVPLTFMNMKREWFEAARLTVIKNRNKEHDLYKEGQKITVVPDVVVPAVQNMDWMRDFTDGPDTERVASLLSHTVSVDQDVNGDPVLVVEGEEYYMNGGDSHEAIRLLANSICGSDQPTMTYLWDSVDEKPWFRNEDPHHEDDFVMTLIMVTENAILRVKVRVDQLRLCLHARRAFYVLSPQDMRRLQSVYPYSEFGWLVRDDGEYATQVVFAKAGESFLLGCIDLDGAEVPLTPILDLFPYPEALCVGLFRSTNDQQLRTEHVQMLMVHEIARRKSFSVVFHNYGDDYLLYNWFTGKMIAGTADEIVENVSHVIFTCSKEDYKTFVALSNPLTSQGRDIYGICDLSHLCEVKTIVDACRLVKVILSPRDLSFFFPGEKRRGSNDWILSYRPVTCLPGDRCHKAPVFLEEKIIPVKLPHRWIQDVRNLFLAFGTVIIGGKGKVQNGYRAHYSSLKPWFETYLIDDPIFFFLSSELAESAVSGRFMNALGRRNVVQMLKKFKTTSSYGIALRWLTELYLKYAEKMQWRSIYSTFFSTYVAYTFDGDHGIAEASWLRGKIVIVVPNFRVLPEHWLRVIVPSSVQNAVDLEIIHDGDYFTRYYPSLEGDYMDPFLSYYFSSVREGEWTARRYDMNSYRPDIEVAAMEILDYLNLALVSSEEVFFLPPFRM